MHSCFLEVVYNEIKTATFFLIIDKLEIVAVYREINGGYLR